MKKIIVMVFAIMMLMTSVVLAHNDTVTMPEGANIASIEKIAVARPLYVPLKDFPSLDELTLAESNGAAKNKVIQVVPYADVANGIKVDTGKDIDKLDCHVAAKLFRDNVKRYADAYVLLTVANNTRTVFYFDVYRSGTNELLYSNRMITTTDESDTIKDYTGMVQDFYNGLETSQKMQIKEQEKAREDAAKAAEKAQREREREAARARDKD